MNQLNQSIKDYISLTKPRIMLLVIFSGITAAIMEGSLLQRPFDFFLAILALYLTGGSANAFNHYLEREKDARMLRTRKKRPLPSGRLKPGRALIFAIVIGVIGILIYGFYFNWLSAFLSFVTIFFYAVIYTLLLKPHTYHNTVIGGAAGAMAPVGVWAAASGSLDITPWTLFLIIFLWSPPHFWALAISLKDDYKKANLKMLPVLKGETETLRQIYFFSFLLFAASITPLLFQSGLIYLIIAVIAGLPFIRKARNAKRTKKPKAIWDVFHYSIFYLFILLIGLIIDAFFLISLNG
jgi:heme o synthase